MANLQMRPLSPREVHFAMSVYRASLPYASIYILDGLNPAQSACTIAAPLNPGLMAGGDPVEIAGAWAGGGEELKTVYRLFMGPEAYQDCSSDAWAAHVGYINGTFIHELCHVWQGFHGTVSGAYMLQSLWAQSCTTVLYGDRNMAYNCAPGLPWQDYNVEQQARLVQTWFERGRRQDDPIFPYIRDVIWAR